MDLPSTLVYTSDDSPGITRRGAGKGFAFYSSEGVLISDAAVKKRLNSLALPPAYSDVWFCPDPRGHLQATGLDDRKRKQYRYHADWSDFQNRRKFDSLLEFSEALPTIRRKVQRDLTGDSLDKSRVVAAVIRLLDRTAARIGNDAYFKENGTRGLTTLLDKDADVEDGHLLLHYIAKGGEAREFDLYQPLLADIVDELQDLPGQRLFQYEGRDGRHPVTSSDVNEWLKEVSGQDISAKDFRTWHASRLTLDSLLAAGEASTKKELKSQEMEALRSTSKELGHRPPVCRKHYVHPAILDQHSSGNLHSLGKSLKIKPSSELTNSELTLLAFLRKTGPLVD